MSALTKFDTKIAGVLIAGARLGITRVTRCRTAGIDPSTDWRWEARGKEHIANGIESEFATYARDLAEAEAAVDAQVETSIIEAGKGDWRASAWWLARRKPDEFGADGVLPIARRVVDAMLARVQERCSQETYAELVDALSDSIEVVASEVKRDLKRLYKP
jgi:hypothetical protein